jgi:hypothetical protein
MNTLEIKASSTVVNTKLQSSALELGVAINTLELK